MRFEGICPRCKSKITIDITHTNTDVVHNSESQFFSCQTSEQHYMYGCSIHGPSFGIEEEVTGDKLDEIIVQCPVCNTMVIAQVIEFD